MFSFHIVHGPNRFGSNQCLFPILKNCVRNLKWIRLVIEGLVVSLLLIWFCVWAYIVLQRTCNVDKQGYCSVTRRVQGLLRFKVGCFTAGGVGLYVRLGQPLCRFWSDVERKVGLTGGPSHTGREQRHVATRLRVSTHRTTRLHVCKSMLVF